MKRVYLLDGSPVDAHTLITLAASLSPEFEKEGILRTSAAAKILRDNDHSVEDCSSVPAGVPSPFPIPTPNLTLCDRCRRQIIAPAPTSTNQVKTSR